MTQTECDGCGRELTDEQTTWRVCDCGCDRWECAECAAARPVREGWDANGHRLCTWPVTEMTRYEVYGRDASLGVYEAESAAAAIEMCAREAGYADVDAMCEALGEECVLDARKV